MNTNLTFADMKSKIFLLITTFSFFNFLNAQKMAHLNLDSLINKMPETQSTRQVIDKFRKDLEMEIINLQTEFETKAQEFQEKENTFSESVKQSKINGLQQMQQRVEEFKNSANGEIQKKYADMTAPIVEKAKKGIESVAKENGYKYVLDTSIGNVLYSESSDDIYAIVLKKIESMPLIVLPEAKEQGKKTPAPKKK